MIGFRQFLEIFDDWPHDMTPAQMDSWIRSIHEHQQDFEDGDLIDRIYAHKNYRLIYCPVNRIKGNWQTYGPKVDEYEQEYQKTKNYPPIVLDEHLLIIDGTHRFEALKKAGVDPILAYLGDNPKLSFSKGKPASVS